MKSQAKSSDAVKAKTLSGDAEKDGKDSDIRIGDLPIMDCEIQNFCLNGTVEGAAVGAALSVSPANYARQRGDMVVVFMTVRWGIC
ncbi:hypothetical protein N5T16_26375 [Escherichia coli]|uniref:hypothetical protein n=1 Tax=Escherichia coli TaxID=562 RepID=UPI0022271AC9|nr:hypothetical protein [Escherichia coli]MCW3282294.1 hypothetical protein [Escherichia coli]